MSKILVITDTSSDIPVELIKPYNIEILPMIFNIDGKPFCEGADFTHENFYSLLPKHRDSIASFQIPAAVYISRFNKALQEGYTDVLVITSDSRVSPMYASAVEGKGMFLEQNPEAQINIHLIDSKSYSMGTGLVVLAAAKLIEQGKSIDEIMKSVNNITSSVQLMVNSFNVRNVSADDPLDWIRKLAAEMTHPFPTFSIIESDAVELPIVKGDHTAFDQFLSYCTEALTDTNPPYAVGYAIRVKEAKAIAMLLEEELGYPPVALYKQGAFSSYCAGRAAITLAFVGSNRQEQAEQE